MLKLIGKFAINAALLWLISRFFPGVSFDSVRLLLGTAAALAVLNIIF